MGFFSIKNIFVIQIVDVLDATHSAFKVDRKFVQNASHGIVHQSMDARKGSAGLPHRLSAFTLHDPGLIHVHASFDDI